MEFRRYHIVAVVPAFNEQAQIVDVIAGMPDYVRTIIVVDDASTDGTATTVVRLAQRDRRVVLLRHDRNQGVGGAMITGFRHALSLGAQIVVKIDGDGQMPMAHLGDLLLPLVRGEADYAKGNRFRDFQALRRMPPVRRIGNLLLSFFAKAAVGYWNVFDPCNGFVAVRTEALRQLRLAAISRSFFFETSMLGELYLAGAVVCDVPMPACYGRESSHLSVRRVLWEFPPRLVTCFMRRLVLKNFLFDLNMESALLATGLPLLLGGVIFGGLKWQHYGSRGVPAPTGTVVISALLIILGFQLLLSALSEDLRSVPRRPVCGGPLPIAFPVESLPVGLTQQQIDWASAPWTG